MHYHEYKIKEKQAYDELLKLWPIYVELVQRKIPSIWRDVVYADKWRTKSMPNWQKLEYFKLQNRINSSIPDRLWLRIKDFFKNRKSKP